MMQSSQEHSKCQKTTEEQRERGQRPHLDMHCNAWDTEDPLNWCYVEKYKIKNCALELGNNLNFALLLASANTQLIYVQMCLRVWHDS